MNKLFRADLRRMGRSRWFWICLAMMLAVASGLVWMQYSGMDYTVPMSRVIFLPLSFYGVLVAALISLFVGEDFSDGFIRNKIIAGRSRSSIFFSGILTSCAACFAVYLMATVFAGVCAWAFFERDVTIAQVLQHFALGIPMCLVYACCFGTIAILCGNRNTGTVICMFLAFFMLFLCLHTNQFLMQPEYKNGTLNPHYTVGFRRVLYGWLHDLNPCGQAAQLSSMNILDTGRYLLCDLIWGIFAAVGCMLFQRKEIQ